MRDSTNLTLFKNIQLQILPCIKTQYTLHEKIASLSGQELTGITKWVTKLRFGQILGTTSVVRSIQNP